MKKQLLLLFFLSFCFNIISAQKLSIYTEGTIGFLSHKSIKNFHNELKNQIEIDGIKTTDDFSYNYGFNIGFKVNKIKSSFFYGNRVSGAKSSLSDFSGLIRLQNELQGSTFGIIYEPFEYKFNKFHFHIGFKGLVTLSNFSTEIKSVIINETSDEKLNFKSTDIGGGIIASCYYDLKYVIIRAHIDCDLYFSGELKFNDIDDAHLLNESGDKVKTNWSGLNFNIGIMIPMIK